MEAKNKNIIINAAVCKKVGDIAVCMCIPYKGCWECLRRLRNNDPAMSDAHEGAEHSSMIYAMYEAIRDKFIGTPLDISRSKVSSVRCNIQNGNMVISWNTQGSFSALRKTLSLALSCLSPTKLYSKYAENMKFLGVKTSREIFNTCSNDMTAGINKDISFSVVGRINIDKTKLKNLLDKVAVKLPKQTTIPSKDTDKPPKKEKYEHEYPSIKASGVSSVVIADYIRSKSGGMGVEVDSGKVIVYNKSWESKRKALKQPGRIKDYIKQKYEKLKEHLGLILAYMSITQGYADCSTATKLIKGVKASDMKDLISKNL